MGNPKHNRQLRDDTARIVAESHGVSQRYVRMVRSGERDNDDIMESLIEYKQGKNKLLKHLEKLVPITSKPKKHVNKKN